MASLNFILRASTRIGKPGSLALRVIHARKPKTVTLPFRLFPEEWDADSQSVRCSSDDPERTAYLLNIQKRLTNYRDKANRIISDLEKKGEYVVEDIAALFRHSTDLRSLSGYAQRLAEELEENGQFRTAKAYITVCRGLVAFNKGVNPALSDINASLIKEFENHLKEAGKQPNTISYYMRNLRAIYNKAVISKWIAAPAEDPFADVYTEVVAIRKQDVNADKLKYIDFDQLLGELLLDPTDTTES